VAGREMGTSIHWSLSVDALFGGNSFRIGTRVYITNPDGRRVGFTFDPVVEGGLLGAIWRPRFVPDPGVYDVLSVNDITLTQRPDGTFGLYLFGFPYNPDEYTLTTKDQRQYRIGQFSGLRDITDRNGVKLTFTDSGIISSVGKSIEWIRDSQGRITEIIDPAGNSIHYTYDASGDLPSMTDQENNTTSMTYFTDLRHYLNGITESIR
jgi:YD repeat-containing protein